MSSPTQSLSVTHTVYRVRSHLRDSPHQISDVTQPKPPTHPYTRPSAGVGLGTHSNVSSVTRLGKLIAWIEAAQHSVHSAHCPPSAYNPLPFSIQLSIPTVPISSDRELYPHVSHTHTHASTSCTIVRPGAGQVDAGTRWIRYCTFVAPVGKSALAYVGPTFERCTSKYRV